MTALAIPELTGTDKQVAYATTIRNAVILLRTHAERYAEIGGMNQSALRGTVRTTGAIDWENANSSYWLDHFAKRLAAINWTAEDWNRSFPTDDLRNALKGRAEDYADLTTLDGKVR